MAFDYQQQTVVFLEYNTLETNKRVGRWWEASGIETSAYLPFIMVDSGLQWSNGVVDYYNVYKTMVDSELSRPPNAKIEAYAWREGSRIRFKVNVTNLTSDTFGLFENFGEVFGIVYETTEIGKSSGNVIGVVSTIMGLGPGETQSYPLETEDLLSIDWDTLEFLTLADYYPQWSTTGYHMLQAAYAEFVDFSIQPKQLVFFIDPSDQIDPSINLHLSGHNSLSWEAVEDIPWLSISSQSGNLPTTINVNIDPGMLSPGWQPEQVISFVAQNSEGIQIDQTVHVLTYYGKVSRTFLPLTNR